MLKHQNKSGSTEALRKASLGNDLAGFGVYYTNNIKSAGTFSQYKNEQGIAFHESAIAFASAPMQAAPGADSHVETFEGVSLRVTMDYDVVKKQTIVSVDTLFGVKLIDPDRAVLLGSGGDVNAGEVVGG